MSATLAVDTAWSLAHHGRMPRRPVTPDVVYVRAHAGTLERIEALRPGALTQAEFLRKLLYSGIKAEEKEQRKKERQEEAERRELMRQTLYAHDVPPEDEQI